MEQKQQLNLHHHTYVAKPSATDDSNTQTG